MSTLRVRCSRRQRFPVAEILVQRCSSDRVNKQCQPDGVRGDVRGHLGQWHHQSPQSTTGKEKQTTTKSADILAQLTLALIHLLRHRRKHLGERAQTIGSACNVLKTEFGRIELAGLKRRGGSRQLGDLQKIFFFDVSQSLLLDAGGNARLQQGRLEILWQKVFRTEFDGALSHCSFLHRGPR